MTIDAPYLYDDTHRYVKQAVKVERYKNHKFENGYYI